MNDKLRAAHEKLQQAVADIASGDDSKRMLKVAAKFHRSCFNNHLMIFLQRPDAVLGARSPHAGGWWIKTLANLGDLRVHYAYCDDVIEREKVVLDAFGKGLSKETLESFHESRYPMPFANLTNGRGRKELGIRGATASLKSSGSLRP